MLMDNMAYLQQIAGGNNNVPSPAAKNSDNPLSKFLNIWTALIAGAITIIIVIIMVVAGLLNKVDTKDQDLLLHSYWQSYYLSETTFSDYMDYIKSSDIRNMVASFRSVVNEVRLNSESLLLSEFSIEADDDEEGEIPTYEKEINDTLNSELEDGRLSGTLDRVILREMLMQIANLRSYESEIAERTKNESIREFSEKTDKNLDNIYNQFHEYKSLAL